MIMYQFGPQVLRPSAHTVFVHSFFCEGFFSFPLVISLLQQIAEFLFLKLLYVFQSESALITNQDFGQFQKHLSFLLAY